MGPPPTSQPRTYAEVASQPLNPGLQAAAYVYVQRGGAGPPLAPAYAGPYKVVQLGPKYFVLEIEDHHEAVAVDWLKPHTGSTLAAAANLPGEVVLPDGLCLLLIQSSRSLDLVGAHIEAAL